MHIVKKVYNAYIYYTNIILLYIQYIIHIISILLYYYNIIPGQGRPRMTWSQVVEKDMRECGLKSEDVKDRRGGEGCCVELLANPCIGRGNGCKMIVVHYYTNVTDLNGYSLYQLDDRVAEISADTSFEQ